MTIFEKNMEFQPALPTHHGSYKQFGLTKHEPDSYDMTFLTPDMFNPPRNRSFHGGFFTAEFVAKGLSMDENDPTIKIPGTDRKLYTISISLYESMDIARIEMVTSFVEYSDHRGNLISSVSTNIILPQWMIYKAKGMARRRQPVDKI